MRMGRRPQEEPGAGREALGRAEGDLGTQMGTQSTNYRVTGVNSPSSAPWSPSGHIYHLPCCRWTCLSQEQRRASWGRPGLGSCRHPEPEGRRPNLGGADEKRFRALDTLAWSWSSASSSAPETRGSGPRPACLSPSPRDPEQEQLSVGRAGVPLPEGCSTRRQLLVSVTGCVFLTPAFNVSLHVVSVTTPRSYM